MAGLLRPSITVAPKNPPVATEHHDQLDDGAGYSQSASADETYQREPTSAANYVQTEGRRDLEPAKFYAPKAQQAQTAQATLPDFSAAGFEGVDIGSRTFPIISLQNDGKFLDIDGEEYPNSFHVNVLFSKKKWCHQGRLTERDILVAFTYDGITTHTGVKLSSTLAEWMAQGRTVTVREYRDILVTLVIPSDPLDGELRILSVPKASIDKWNSMLVTTAIKRKWTTEQVTEELPNLLIEVSVGKKITQKIDFPFYPWSFKLAA